MRRPFENSLSLLPLLFSACLVDAPIVEGNDDESELGIDIASWCDTLCERSEECGIETTEPCLGECVTLFEEFEGKGEICAEAGRRAVSCLDQASCADLAGNDSCLVRGERARCLNSVGSATCGDADTSGTGSPTCQHGFSDCSDGREYTLECFEDGDGSRCACMTNNAIQGEFAAIACPRAEDAIQICAWPIQSAGATQVARAKRCVGGGSVYTDQSCRQSFEQCSDGHSYGVNCIVGAQAVRCECELDGDVVSVYSSAAGICEFFAEDSYDGRVALNYACGFSIEAVPQSAD